MSAPEKIVIGNAELWRGDCREILPTLPKVDAVITDPPYGVSVAGSANVAPSGTRVYDFFPGDTDWASMQRLARDVAAGFDCLTQCWWCGHRQIGALVEYLESAGYSTRMLAWRKKCPAPMPPGAGFSTAFELCVYGYKPRRAWNGSQYESSMFTADSYRHGQPGKVDHPTQKPLSLMEWQVSIVTHCGEMVADPFMGSGTTGVACMNLGRQFVGIEKERKYFDIACERIENAQRQARLIA